MTCGCSGPSLVGGARKSRRSGYCHCKSCRHCSKCHRCKKCGMKMRMTKKRSTRKMKGGSVLGNALPSLVLYGLSRSLRDTKKNSNRNSMKTRKTRRGRKSRRM